MDALKWSSTTAFCKKLNLSLLMFSLVIFLAVFLFSSVMADENKLGKSNNYITQQLGVKSPATDLWRAVRQREFKGASEFSSSTQSKSLGANEFINIKGQEWRQFRMDKLIPYARYLLGGVILVLVLFRLIRGKIKIKAGRSGKKILRFTSFQRFVHWSTAILFIILGVTGLLLTFGKSGLVPIIGNEIFGSIAGVGKIIHDYLGPVFGLFLLVMLFTFIKGNFGNWTDIKWFLKGGGMFGGHASAGRYNGGEKAWFWLAILGGAVVVVSGIILDFPFFDQTRDDLQLSQVVHAIGAVIILAASFGHIFMGTVAMEGAYETMKTGYCDENWAKEHHDIWYEELLKQGVIDSSVSNSNAAFTDSNISNDRKNEVQNLVVHSSKTEKKNTAISSNTLSSDTVLSNSDDNLKKIEGIGPKIEEILKIAGINTYTQLSKAKPEEIKAILNDAGPRYKMHNPQTWPQQAELANKGAWDELSEFQDQQLGG